MFSKHSVKSSGLNCNLSPVIFSLDDLSIFKSGVEIPTIIILSIFPFRLVSICFKSVGVPMLGT